MGNLVIRELQKPLTHIFDNGYVATLTKVIKQDNLPHSYVVELSQNDVYKSFVILDILEGMFFLQSDSIEKKTLEGHPYIIALTLEDFMIMKNTEKSLNDSTAYPAAAVHNDSAFTALEILHHEYGVDDTCYVRYISSTEVSTRRHKIHSTPAGRLYIGKFGRKYYIDQFMRV